MSARPPLADSRKITLPQVLALMAIWTAVIYGVSAKHPAEAEQISLKAKPAQVACAKQG
jgi:hypothetical protein